MKQFLLEGHYVKRLFYNKPIIPPINPEDWVLNLEQPSEGITIKQNEIFIRKFKPNVWIIKSKYSNTQQSDFLNRVLNKTFEITGLQKARIEQKITQTSFVANPETNWTLYPEGFVVSPISNNNLLLQESYPSSMNISGGSFKTRGGWNVLGWWEDGQIIPYNYEVFNENYPQLAFTLYSGAQVNNQGFITLSTPIIIKTPNTINLKISNPIDITTQEVFKLYNKDELLYERDKTIQNLYYRWGFIYLNNGSIWFKNPETEYSPITIPVATDLVNRLQNQEYFKFGIEQYDTGKRTNNFWETVISTINNIKINKPFFAENLFFKENAVSETDFVSGGAKGMNTANPLTLNQIILNFKAPEGINNFKFSIRGALAATDWEKKVLVKYDNENTNIHSLTSATNFGRNSKIKELVFQNPIYLSEIINMLYNATNIETLVANFANGVIDWDRRITSEPFFSAAYAFCNCSLNSLSWNGDKTLIMCEYSPYFIYGSNIKNIADDNILDMKFVNPANTSQGSFLKDGSQIFGYNLERAKIKNLNKGNWVFECPLDDDSVIYLLSNVYDLTTNVDSNKLKYLSTTLNYGLEWHVYYTGKYEQNGTYNRNRNFHKNITFDDISDEDKSIDIVWDYEDKYEELTPNGVSWAGYKRFVFSYSFKENVSQYTPLSFNILIKYLNAYGNVVEENINANINKDEEFDLNFTHITGEIVRIVISTYNNNEHTMVFNFEYKNEVSEVTQATIKFNNVQNKSVFNNSISIAQQRGWTVQF